MMIINPNNNSVENEANAKARSKSVAINKNWNILYYPGYSCDGRAAALADPIKDTADSDDLLGKFCTDGEENEAVAASEAKSEAEIKNKNINVVVYL